MQESPRDRSLERQNRQVLLKWTHTMTRSMSTFTRTSGNYLCDGSQWRHHTSWTGAICISRTRKCLTFCLLSPFSGIVEHNVKKFNRFEEIGYIECQLRRVFHVPDHKKSRLWISEKAQVKTSIFNQQI